MTVRAKGFWTFVSMLFSRHPGLAIGIFLVIGTGLFLDRHPEVIAALATGGAFGEVPQGWLALIILAQFIGLYAMSRRLNESARDSRILRTALGRMILLVDDKRRDEATAIMKEADELFAGADSLPPRDYTTRPLKGKRWYETGDDR